MGKPKQILAIIGIGIGMIVLGMIFSSVNMALASIQKDFSASVLELQWMMNTFGIGLCVPLLTMGKLGDAYGRKRLYLCGLAISLVAAFVGGFAKTQYQLILSMGLFGFGGSLILPLSQALLVHQFPVEKKEKAVALWSIFASVTLACGPLVAGVLLNWFGWRWIYLLDVPLVLLACAMVYFFVEKEKEFHKPHCDWSGVTLFALIVASLIIAVLQGPEWGWNSPLIIGLFIFCFASFCFFIFLERKTEAPLFRPDLFSNRSFLFAAIPNGCTIGFIWVSFFLIPLFLQNMRNDTPLRAGFILLYIILPLTLLSVPIAKLYKRLGAKPLMLSGYACFIAAFLLQSLFIRTLWGIELGCLAIGLGWALTWGPSISCALSSISHNIAGIASGMFTTLQELGGIVFLALGGVVFRTVQQNRLAPNRAAIESALPADQFDSLISNPAALEKQLGADSPIFNWTEQAFYAGYEITFWFLFGVCLFAILMTLFLPSLEKTPS